MCSTNIIQYASKVLTKELCADKCVLEIGSLNVNGSVRAIVEQYEPLVYRGIDLVAGPGVDRIMDVQHMPYDECYDLVICTEVLEHIGFWPSAIENIKRAVVPGGWLFLTTCSPGFSRHGYPSDHWRFDESDMLHIFREFDPLHVTFVSDVCGIYVFGQKPDLSEYRIYNVNTKKREYANWIRVSADLEIPFPARVQSATGTGGKVET